MLNVPAFNSRSPATVKLVIEAAVFRINVPPLIISFPFIKTVAAALAKERIFVEDAPVDVTVKSPLKRVVVLVKARLNDAEVCPVEFQSKFPNVCPAKPVGAVAITPEIRQVELASQMAFGITPPSRL